MPFVGKTPEALLTRTDSKRTESTCHGLTANGLPCRRAASPPDRYCWQHKSQAQSHSQPSSRPAVQRTSSLDTLADRLGLLSIQSPAKPKKRSRLRVLCCCFGVGDWDDIPQPVRVRRPLVPEDLPPATVAALKAEIARPASETDEPGYIYIFWLLHESSPRSGGQLVLHAGGHQEAMLLKIGRAANVQRRMNQWSRQCGYDIELLRYYPYTQAGSSPRPTRHAKKVERLVHLELEGMGMRARMGTCAACGKEHKEWFHVDAERGAVAAVDAVIRKWIEWDERAPPV